MEEFSSSLFEGIGNTVRKRRSDTSRRPRPESQLFSDGRDISSLSSTPLSDDKKTDSSNGNCGDDRSSRRKELSLTQCASRFSGARAVESKNSVRKRKKVDVGLTELYGNRGFKDTSEQGRHGLIYKESGEGVLVPANLKSISRAKVILEPQKTMILNTKADGSAGSSQDRMGNDNKVKKVKLKVGGVTRTIDANSKSSCILDTTVVQHKLAHKDVLENNSSPSRDKQGGLQGIPLNDFSKGGFDLGKEESSMKEAGKNSSVKQVDKSDSVRKSKRAPNKRAFDGFGNEDDDDEIRYLEKVKNARYFTVFEVDKKESSRKHRRLSKFSEDISQNSEVGSSSWMVKGGKKISPYEVTDYEEEEELVSDGEVDGQKKNKTRNEPVDALLEPRPELTLTTRQRALQAGRDASVPVELPDELPTAPPRKQKEKLSEVDQQLKKAEAAQRRKMQNERAARKLEDEAIKKIRGQDSSRKKREERKNKRVKERAQEKATDELMRASSTIKLIMGPSGTTVTFPNEMGLPSIFDSKCCSYPPARERCVGPSCTNPYKYRDSKTKLPLCSLRCYKAVQGNKLLPVDC